MYIANIWDIKISNIGNYNLKNMEPQIHESKNDEIKKQKIIFLRFYLFTLREKGRQGEKEGEKH